MDDFRIRRWLNAALASMLLASAPAWAQAAATGGAPVDAAVGRYDPARDAAADIARALAAVPATGKRVLLIVGGDWCKDCRVLDALFAADPGLAALRDARFIPVKVFVGTENRNDAVLGRYPRLEWVPTLIELNGDGRVRRMVPTTQLHEGNQLVAAKLRAFLDATE
jgi:thiol:disulfide interchange protein